MALLTNFLTSILLFTFIFCTLALVRDIYGIIKNYMLHTNYSLSEKRVILFGIFLSYIITYIIMI